MTEPTDLQFERAQFDAPVENPACHLCKSPLFGSYFEVNGHTVCEACCYKLRELGTGGSRLGRVIRASAAGAAAALGGAILYWGILAATGYEFALIAIVVGFAVGKAVRWGSRGRGGWAYQTLAVVLTYFAIVTAYVPLIVKEIMKQPQARTEALQADDRGAAAAPAAVTSTAPPASSQSPDRIGAGAMALGLLALLAIACAAPFLQGVSNVIGIVIIAVGLYEAWKLNRRQPLVVTGPHTLTARAAAAASE